MEQLNTMDYMKIPRSVSIKDLFLVLGVFIILGNSPVKLIFHQRKFPVSYW